MKFEFMRADGQVHDLSAQVHTADGGASFTVDGSRYSSYASFGNTHAYTATALPTPANLLQVAMPEPLGGILYPAPVLWVSEHGIEAHYRKRGMRDSARPIQLDCDQLSVHSDDGSASCVLSESGDDSEDSDAESVTQNDASMFAEFDTAHAE